MAQRSIPFEVTPNSHPHFTDERERLEQVKWFLPEVKHAWRRLGIGECPPQRCVCDKSLNSNFPTSEFSGLDL